MRRKRVVLSFPLVRDRSMAAYAALVSLMNDLELIPNHPTHSFSFAEEQTSSLLEIVHLLIDFLETYDYYVAGREAAQVLESRIATVTHAAHDVIESHIVDQIHAGSTVGGKATSCFLHDLQKAIEDMEFVKAKATQVKAKRRLGEEEPTYPAPTSFAPLISGKNDIVGFEDAAFQLMDMFIGGSPSKRIVPIVGMGGIGKTTFAKYIYEDSLIKRHFDVRLYATISQEYRVENIIKELLSGQRNSTTSGDVGELGEKLHKKLWGRRYLIVLDDMWSEGAWDKIRMFLPDDGSGSCVIVTTRLSKLAAHLSPSPFVMKFLDDDKSWELFCRNAFGEEDCPLELEELGKKIVKRCGGLPLSIVVIGGHLKRSSKEIDYWEDIANLMSPISSLAEEEQCLKIMSLSYEHLPACLKPCLLYLGIFQKEPWIDASAIPKYWVCEGLLKPKKGVSLEEVAEDYLKDLIDRNLIIVRRRSWNGEVYNYNMHDIVKELCLKVAKKEKFMCVLRDTTTHGIQSARRMVIPDGKQLNPDTIAALKSAAPLLRTLILPGGHPFSGKLSVDFRLLRVSAYAYGRHSNRDGTCFLCAYFRKVNLRYLAFNVHPAELDCCAPFPVSACWNLQTLIMGNFDLQQVTLPVEIWEMPQLRHLDFLGHCLLPDPIPCGGPNQQQERIVLHNLQRLSGAVNLRFTEEVCKRIPNLKFLSAYYHGSPNDVRGSSYYCIQNIGHFSKLKSLSCELFDGDSKWRDVFLSFAFPASLEELSLLNCHLYWEDLTRMIQSLPRLGFLQVTYVHGSEWNLDEEEFHCLKFLEIFLCGDLTHLNANSSHFPVLESLEIWTTPQLKEIPSGIGEIPTLTHIRLSNCSVCVAVSAMRILVEQENDGNLEIQLDVSFWERESLERFQNIIQEEGLESDSLNLDDLDDSIYE